MSLQLDDFFNRNSKNLPPPYRVLIYASICSDNQKIGKRLLDLN